MKDLIFYHLLKMNLMKLCLAFYIFFASLISIFWRSSFELQLKIESALINGPQFIHHRTLMLMKRVFVDDYPTSWGKLIFRVVPKSGHPYNNQKVRGVAIGPILSRLYDCIIDQKTRSWYVPNREQAGFRKGQGCLILVLLINFTKDISRELFIGLSKSFWIC